MAADLAHYVRDLSIILGTAAATGLISQSLRQPPVLGYLIAGMLIGPHVPGIVLGGPDSLDMTQNLSEFGVILLMFSVGLEFSLRKIARIGPGAGLTAVFEIGLMMTLGFLVSALMGWSTIESLFLAGCICSSSTMIAAKAFEERKLRGSFVDLTFAILVFDDMTTIMVFAVLTAIASGAGLGPGEFALSVGQLFGFLLALLAGGLFVVPRAIRAVVRRGRDELTLLAAIAACFGMASLAALAGYSIALGAFIAGILVSESGEGGRIEPLVLPVRNIFAAIFFVAIGMQIDPLQILANWPLVLIFTAVVLVGKVLGVSIGAFLSGNGFKASVRAGMSCAHNGEFSFIMASFAISKGILGDWVFPVAVGVSVLTQLTAPLMIGRSESVALALEQRLPAKLQTFITFYQSWIEQLRSAPRTVSVWSQIRGDVVVLALDAALLWAVLAGSNLVHWWVVTELTERFTLPPWLVELTWLGGTLLLAAIFLLGALRRAAALAHRLAEMVIPVRGGKLDLGSAPRHLFVLVLELALCLVVGLPLVGMAQPFLPLSAAPLVLLVVVVALVISVWRNIAHLHGHVRAGTELIVEVLAKQSREGGGETTAQSSLDDVQALLPGFPDMTPVRLHEGSAAVGLTLAQINLRVRTGATVLAVSRDGASAEVPSPRELLRPGDILTLTGSEAAITTAKTLIHEGPAADPARLESQDA
ncbi:cation:proton antiporter [Nannocystis sp. ILAH1]|uniref:cation:proton antiporter domain-containing protein n=1 Tax=Nannocystis sp. ILAH1 TaxID=2996789 RepID=UPI0022706AC9|nr:cation:proton antiporter [Nannocystis sp. ILAH1]MCY0989320.1 cation:proton antiporter [Nannocystis sp. ILAH1]